MEAFIIAVKALISKNLRLLFLRRSLLILIFAYIIPIVIGAILSFGGSIFGSAKIASGTGDPAPIKSLKDAFEVGESSGRHHVYLVNSGHTGGDIDRVLDRFETAANDAGTGMEIHRIEDGDELPKLCESSARGVTKCFGAIIMSSSPKEGKGGLWDYTIQCDAVLSFAAADVSSHDNPMEVYYLPMQREIDRIIASIENKGKALSETTEEYSFSFQTAKEADASSGGEYEGTVASIMAIPFIIPMILLTFHLTGFVAGERESGMAQLIDSMSITRQPWVSQVARMSSNYLSFLIVYMPSWIIISIFLKVGLIDHSSYGVVFCLQFLGGLAFTSYAMLFGSFFKKTQWSGISAFMFAVVMGVVVCMAPDISSGAAMALSLLFTPACYIYYLRAIATVDARSMPVDLTKSVEIISTDVRPILLVIFFIVQIIVYPLLAAFVERWRHGTAFHGRKVLRGDEADSTLGDAAVRIEGFKKIYKPGFWTWLCCCCCAIRKRKTVTAVENLDFTASKGQIVALLGANGSGKTTTLDSIGGLKKMSGGTITIDGKGGLGIAPQQNVLWDTLTVEEHLVIFDKLKAETPSPHEEILDLIINVGLLPKRHALAKTLSGGQKRKLQLGMMLVGGSTVCCVDEVSSGIDPLSRRNIWDILMAERGRRTLILTTHFLDEADMLADHIAILSKGTLRAEGSSVQLKDSLGGGYRVHVSKRSISSDQIMPIVAGTEQKDTLDQITYIAPSSELAAAVIKKLEAANVKDYRFSNPTLEDVFLQLAEEIEDQEAFRNPDRVIEFEDADLKDHDAAASVTDPQDVTLELEDSRLTNFMEQSWILFYKRIIVLKRNWVPTLVAIAFPIVVSGICLALAKKMSPPVCNFEAGAPYVEPTLPQVLNEWSRLVIGPSSSFKNNSMADLIEPIVKNHPSDWWLPNNKGSPFAMTDLVDTYDEFRSHIDSIRSDAAAGIWLGDQSNPPTVAWLSMDGVNSVGAQCLLDMIRTKTSISTSITTFPMKEFPSNFHGIQIAIYTALALIASAPLLALYPSNERRLLVRGMMYSNGVKPLALWLAYFAFDFTIVLVNAAVMTGIWAGGADTWYHVPYMFPVFLFYGLAAVMFSNLISLTVKSQLATWALSAIIQAAFFAGYLGGLVSITEQVQPSLITSTLNTMHFALAVFAPIVSVIRAVLVATNLYQISCVGNKVGTNPGSLTLYGGPILYLAVQAVILCALVIFFEGGLAGSLWNRIRGEGKRSTGEKENHTAEPGDMVARSAQGGSERDGLQIEHLTKSFGNNLAVDDVSFDIKRGEVFALLGPNGAGKSTIISLIRGDLKPSVRGGQIQVDDHSVLTDLAAARTKLGVCPQFDALDIMTVREHLRFYARIRGISNVNRNVDMILRAVGLEAFADRMAHALSGGNKRKLSLGIALVGNPTVLLLDEPSSGLDAASKRIMWQTLASTTQGRSILLTTHSMEEADALASRVGIISHRMLAHETPERLRHRFGDIVHVHLICESAPRTSDEEMESILSWIRSTFRSAGIEDKTYHGQIRFSVSGADVLAVAKQQRRVANTEQTANTEVGDDENANRGAVGQIVVLLESVKEEYGIGNYSVVPTTLDQVFLSIVRAHSGEEENQYEVKLDKWAKFGRFICS